MYWNPVPRRAPIFWSILLAWRVAGGVAHADCLVDQEQSLGSALVHTVGSFGESHYRVAQTFTTGVNGVLGEVQVRGCVSAEPAGTGPLTLQIFPTVAGVPDESAGALLTHVVPFSELPVGVFPIPDVAFDVSSYALPVQDGDVLALTLSTPSGAFLWVLRSSAPYGGGTAWTREESATGWTDNPADLTFRTVVCAATVSVETPQLAETSWGATKSAYRGVVVPD
ncbi:MAG: hypothetical protein DHS20C21_19750 [Gemmatimonadota bacterium]|nr:MAG: hypothetical protein DHS20C21_19750 [Gemmatimonadota bacterium]